MQPDAPSPDEPQVRPRDLFLAFAALTLHSFGGALFWSRRMLIEKRRWLSEQEFVEILAVAQLLPGANGTNLAAVVGYRFAGLPGALAAMAGFMGPPLLVIGAIGVVYYGYADLTYVQQALKGMAAVAVGLVIAMGAKIARVLGVRWLPWTLAILTFVAIGLLRWPLLVVVAVLAPLAIAAAWKGHF